MNVDKPKFLAVILCLAFVSACQKKESKIAPDETVIQSEPTPRKDSVNGSFLMYRAYHIEKNMLRFWNALYNANFSETLLSTVIFNSLNFADAGTVKLNNVELKKFGDTDNIWYREGNEVYFTPPFKWEIMGNSDFKPFAYTLDIAYPVFEGVLSIPDTVQITNDKQIYFLGTDADSLRLSFSSSITNADIQKRIEPKFNSITLSIDELKYLSNNGNSPFEMRLTLQKYEYRTFGGKYYQFVTHTEIYKVIYPSK